MSAVATKSPATDGSAMFANPRGAALDASATRIAGSPHSLGGLPLPVSLSPALSADNPLGASAEDILGGEQLPEPICGGCKKLIDEESADAGVIHFATQLWHVDCFRCAKCRNPVTTDRDDILLLSDGHPICGQCNYSCQICNMPIMEEAIMTGDESYHASCFVCRSCHTPIAELVFAKTSQGIYCMKCHNQRVARSRRHAEKKRQAAAAAAAGGAHATNTPASTSSGPTLGNASPAGSAMSGLTNNTRVEAKKSPTASTFSASDHRSPSIPSAVPNSPTRRESQPNGAADPSHSKTANGSAAGANAPTSSSGTSLSPFLQSGSSSSVTGSSSVGQSSSRRPMNAPHPSGLKLGKNDGNSRPSTSDSTGFAGHVRSSSSSKTAQATTAQHTALARLEGDLQSPLLAGVLEQASANERRRQMAERSESQLSTQMPNSLSKRSSSENRASSSLDTMRKDVTGLGIGGMLGQQQLRDVDVDKDSSLSASRDSHAGGIDDDESQPTNAQLKRASRLHIADPATGETRLSRTFSFYDPDIVGLMDSFGRFESSEDFSLDSLTKKSASATKPTKREKKETDESTTKDGVADDEELQQASSAADKNGKRGSEATLSRLSENMRKSIQRARDGQVNMDTAVLEEMLDELDTTRERMKTLQRKYEKIRRASQQAAQGFSSAREEYEQEVQARYDAEADMLNLKRQLHVQASRLAELATERRQQENLHRRNVEIKSSIQDMERDLARLRIERDMTMGEVAELLVIQEGRGMSSSNNEDVIKRNLTHRLEGVKDKYRGEIQQLVTERDALLLEIEELRQSREVFTEEAQSLNARNEELNGALALLQRRVEHAQAAEKLVAQRSNNQNPSQHQQQQPYASSSTARGGTGAFGFGFGANKQAKTPVSATSTTTTTFDAASSQGAGDWPDQQLAYASPVPVTKIETAPKKFKWMKAPKLTVEHARTAGHQIAAVLPGMMPPAVPQKNGSQANGSSGDGSRPLSPTSSSYTAVQSTQSGHTAVSHHQHKHSQDYTGNMSLGTGASPGQAGGDIVVKEHLFQPFNVLRPVRCFACQKNMWGQSELKCSFCNQACHVRCLHNLPVSCNQPYSRSDEAPVESTGPPMFGRRLTEQVQSEAPRTVPLVVQRCVEAVEIQGMDYEGIYRKSGGTSQSKIITQLFEKGQPFNLDDRDRFNDISAITSVLKNYFRELPDPLLTFELHERFIECMEGKNRESSQRESRMRELVHTLPKEHFDTLRFLIDHLHRVQGRAEDNRMSSRNLGVVFGPTLMRSSDPTQEFAHMGGKAMTIEFMIDNPAIFER